MISLMKALPVPTAPQSYHTDVNSAVRISLVVAVGGGSVDNDTVIDCAENWLFLWFVAPSTRSFPHCPCGQLWPLHYLVPRVIRTL